MTVRGRQKKIEQLKKPRFRPPESVQGAELVSKQDRGLACVGNRVVHALTHQFVILNKPMIRILREADGREHQGVNDGQLENRQFRCPFPQNRKVMADQVMAKKAVSPLGQVVKLTRGPLE